MQTSVVNARRLRGVPPLLPIILAGVVLGVFCKAADFLPLLSPISQMAGPWVLLAVAAGAWVKRLGRSTKASVMLGASILVIANLAYGLPSLILDGQLPSTAVKWTVVAVVVGPVGGLTGRVALDGREPWRTGARWGSSR